MSKYVPPHLRQSCKTVCYSSTEAFYNGSGGFRTSPISVLTMLTSRKPYKAIVQSKLASIYCCKDDSIDGCHWTINGCDVFSIFKDLTVMFANEKLPNTVQGVKLLPQGKTYKVQVWCEDVDTDTIYVILKNSLRNYSFHAKCILNRNWNETGHEYKCSPISEIVKP